tara:strand:- start:734 stop:1231 length:498 start_codon:yes stop_codon:yes gene_type:complete
MASTLTASTLTVKITESITLNGSAQGSENTLSIGSIKQVQKRIVSCPANSETTVVHFKQVVGAATKFDGALDVQDVKYVRLTNLDNSNSLTLSLQVEVGEDDSGADTSASLLVEPGKSFIIGSPHDGIGVSDANANLVTDLVDLDSLVVQPGGNAIDVEVFVAST